MLKSRFRNIAFVLVLAFTVLTFTQCTDGTQQFIEESVKELNAQCPVQFDYLTRLDNCEALPGHIMKYNYTLLFDSKVQVDTADFKAGMTPILLYKIQTNESLAPVKEKKVSFAYSYKDSKGQPIGTIVITPEEYSKPPVKPQEYDLSRFVGEDIQLAMETMVKDVKKQLPINITEQMLSIIDCNLLNQNQLEYTYKLHSESVSDFDTTEYKEVTFQNTIESLRSDPTIKTLADKGISIHYKYLDKDGNYLCTLAIPASELK